MVRQINTSNSKTYKTCQLNILIHTIGRFEMEGVDMFDFEDIALGPGPEGPDGPDYIYIGDIGNNWDGHCRGINADDYVVYRIPEPDVDALR